MEEQLIRNRLKGFEGIEELRFNILERKLTVAHVVEDEGTIQSAIESVGMNPIRLADDKPAPATSSLVPPRERALIALSGFAAVAAEAVAYATGQERSALVIGVAVLSIALGGRETLRKGYVALRTLTLNINFLMSLAVVGAVAIGQWPEAAMVTFLFGLAEMIEALSLDRARNAVRSLLEMAPETALARDEAGDWHEVKACEVRVGELVRVRPGERLPLDGEIVSGRSNVDQASITGESIPVEKGPGDAVFAGTMNGKGGFEFRVTANTADTALAKIIRVVQRAQNEKAPVQRFIDRFAAFYTPAVVVVAFLVAFVPSLLFSQPPQPWVYKALVMLVIACPCALVISTPVTVVSGLAAAARRGILIKGGSYLEEGRKIRMVALDKTGTLTMGEPKVTDFVALDDTPKDRLLQLAASLDSPSEHPVASAIVAAWTGADAPQCETTSRARLLSRGPRKRLLPVEGFESITGRGIKGSIGPTLYYIGNHRLVEELGVCGPHVERELGRLEAEGKTTVVLCTAERALAVIGVADTLRDSSVEAVRQLHELGVKTAILTGDNRATAEAIARNVGIDDVSAELLPDDKLSAVEALIAVYGVVGMVGDGINDAPALAKANVGFAMGAAGTDTALETADVALMRDDLRKLPEFIRLSRATASILGQNIALALVIKVVFFALALTGMATLWMAVFADMGGSLLVVANGLRLLRFKNGAHP